jgi:hypothetical protein
MVNGVKIQTTHGEEEVNESPFAEKLKRDKFQKEVQEQIDQNPPNRRKRSAPEVPKEDPHAKDGEKKMAEKKDQHDDHHEKMTAGEGEQKEDKARRAEPENKVDCTAYHSRLVCSEHCGYAPTHCFIYLASYLVSNAQNPCGQRFFFIFRSLKSHGEFIFFWQATDSVCV